MSKLSIKTLTRKNLPYGKFKFQVLLNRECHNPWRAATNASEIEAIRGLLGTTCKGKFKLVWELNSRGKKVYTHLYLVEPMDLAMIKLVHLDKLYKIYKINVEQLS